MKHDSPAGTSTILFGAFDRHNFGDLLFPHIAAALLPGKDLIYAGLAERDLRPYGGHQVMALSQLEAKLEGRSANILLVGGELLTCNAWQAALMLQAPELVQPIIAQLDAHETQRRGWAREILGINDQAPYTVTRERFPDTVSVIYNGVGGVGLADQDPHFRSEMEAKLKVADFVGVRDRVTLNYLATRGIASRLMPDPAVMVAELFGEKIHLQAQAGETARILDSFPQGYIAVQFSADFGDDATLTAIASQLDQATRETGLGVVFFRAGAAPWHDDMDCYQRIAMHMQPSSVKIFTSLNLWSICALIANSKCYCGSSLHGRIVAMAFALPRINLRHPSEASTQTKQAAYSATWEQPGCATIVEVQHIARGIRLSMAADIQTLKHTASELSKRYRESFDEIRVLLK